MVVILNNSSFQFSKVRAQFQRYWNKKKLEPLCMAIINSYEKKIMILAMISVSKMKNSVYNLIGLDDSRICEHYLTEFFRLRLLKTHKYARKWQIAVFGLTCTADKRTSGLKVKLLWNMKFNFRVITNWLW